MFHVEFHQYLDASGYPANVLRHAGQELGRPLVDSAHGTAGYRFLPVLCLAHAAYLGWSPHTELMLPDVFRPTYRAAGREDAGREDLVALFTLQYATRFADADWAELVDPHLVTGVLGLAAGARLPFTESDWTRTLSGGLAAWRDLHAGKGENVLVDPAHHRLEVRPR
ncbi:hypothetical protein RCO28_08590 [Streptomyces sp. LHD-70]|uniref:hypothetical protein n=1 Tax=Streptomyces sp. LHD-70 TaxID=3072140 RepID=UPI00280FBCE9|nr:hypothetical protein [Streptomyces sp. LHD-70]MDQ8702548.1 hypothetical protein [Streptomyces sp. LHD-70]